MTNDERTPADAVSKAAAALDTWSVFISERLNDRQRARIDALSRLVRSRRETPSVLAEKLRAAAMRERGGREIALAAHLDILADRLDPPYNAVKHKRDPRPVIGIED